MAEQLKHTPFYDLHVAAGAKMVPFAGYEMPVQYQSGITFEHNAVRKGVGLFDVSHMGEFRITGKDALAFVSYITSNDPAALVPGQVQYSSFLHATGGIVDDCLVYRYPDHMFIVVNAANIAKDWENAQKHAKKFDVKLENLSDDLALLALQGPRAQETLQPLTKTKLQDLVYYHFVDGEVAGAKCMIGRTGYTGEDGFELCIANRDGRKVWDAIMKRPGVVLTGLGARDSLRLEVAYPLYGNDIDDETTPLEAGLGWITKLKKPEFVGQKRLVEQKSVGVVRKLVGFRLTEKGFPRHGMPVLVDGSPFGAVRSGTVSPSTGEAIGTCYLPVQKAAVGTKFAIDIRGKAVGAEVVPTPFWKHGSVRK